MTVGAPQMLQHVAYHGRMKPGGAQPSSSLVWVRSFLLLDGLPEKDKESHLLGPATRGVAHICRCIKIDIRETLPADEKQNDHKIPQNPCLQRRADQKLHVKRTDLCN